MSTFSIQTYYRELEKTIHYGGSKKETAIRNAFYYLLNEYAHSKDLMLIPEISTKNKSGKLITPDGTIKDSIRNDWGYWESKDEADDINEEIKKKFAKGYPADNILFEDSKTAVLYQHGDEVMRRNMQEEDELHDILTRFLSYERPEVHDFRVAIEKFKDDIPKVTVAIRDIIESQQKTNTALRSAQTHFLEIAKASINPDITAEDVKEMMIQHILSADIFNTIFDEPHFHQENNIARELNKIIETFFTGTVRRQTLGQIKHYYDTINARAASIADHHEKQKFLKVVYENFYKGYNPKAADRLGIVYTPNEIVQFMIRSTDYLLHKHFGKTLGDKNVEILDPATGTGTFITDIIDYLPKGKLKHKYKNELHANEVAILPYYIANLNIEYTYKQKMGEYAEFDNLCFVDTLDKSGRQLVQGGLFVVTAENASRIKRQNERKISVIIGNPPYNARQENYNYQNANRAYLEIDKRIKNTYIKHGTAQNQIVVYDMYTRFFRWASDRIQDDGAICFISNNSYIDGKAFDGFRKSIYNEFQYAYIIDLGGNIRELSGKDGIFLNEDHTIFGQAAAVGIAVCFLIKDKSRKLQQCHINYIHPCDIRATRNEKISFLNNNPFEEINFESVVPDKRHNWINQTDNDWDTLIPLIDKLVKAGKMNEAVFHNFSLGVASHRDQWVYDLSKNNLENKIKYFIEVYTETLANREYKYKGKIAWDRELSNYLRRQIEKKFEKNKICTSLFRPFVKQYFYFDKHLNGMLYQFPYFYSDKGNVFMAVNREGNSKPFHLLSSDSIIDLHTTGDSQCLPLYTYDKGERKENITDWAWQTFKERYKTELTKVDIFHYVYSVLHNPAYRKKYELNLKREFPRIPLYDDFPQWAKWGEQLMNLHINYESVEPYALKRVQLPSGVQYKGIVDQPKAKLKALKEDGIIQLDSQTELHGIPKQAWDYKLGNRSALEWILDQYKEKKPSDPTIAEKFNTYRFADYKEQVIDLLKRVCTVSVETTTIINAMELKA